MSGVPQGTVFGPLLSSLYINDISSDIESEIGLFADDFVCYHEIKDEKDTMKLQRDIDRLGSWARKWGMRFQHVKCNIGERGGSVVECRTPEQEVGGSKPTAAVLCP